MLKKKPLFWRIDAALTWLTKLVSYIPPVCLFAVGIIATVNILTTKLFHWAVPSVNDWISYFLIPIVYLALAHVQMDQGMVSVDFVSRHFPKIVYDILITIWDLVFSVVAFYISRNMFTLVQDFLRLHKRSSVLPGSFPLWPMALILGIGMLLYGISTIWIAIRRFVPNPDKPAEKEAEK